MDQTLHKLDDRTAEALGRLHDGQHMHKPPGSAIRDMRTFGSFAVVYLYRGRGHYHDANGFSRAVAAGDMILLFPELPHRYGAGPDTPWHEYYLVFDGPVFEQWRQAGLLDPMRPIWRLRPIQTWRHRFEAVIGDGRDPGWVQLARLQLTLAEALATQSIHHDGPQQQRWIDRARAMLDQNLEQPLSMPDAARALGVSYDHFRKRFTRLAGVGPLRYRAGRVIDRARLLMRTSDMSDKQIAASLGFCDEFYFSRRFKHLAGCSPSDYRRTLGRSEC
ncbi:MAG: helix-turn-helix transcriptional regulator [Phycisphaeraceae bacterium]|nr:helix-turn-helix transcriptional regulator [Phycisphaeraceae bacterium]